MSTATRLITADELLLMPEEHPRSCELVEGEIVRMSPPGFAHAIVSQTLSHRLWDFVAKRRLGQVIISEVGFIVGRNPDTVLAPDGAFIRQDRCEALGVPVGYYPEVPALIFEVVSPNDKSRDVVAKIQRWLGAGVELAWVVDPAKRTVTIYSANNNPQVLSEKETLTADPVLSGFHCPVADLFAGL